MPAWITIYCQRPIGRIESASLLASILEADLYTLAEYYGVDEELVAPSRRFLRVEMDGEEEAVGFTLHYRPGKRRQLDVHRWTDAARVAEEREEALETLDDTDQEIGGRIQAALAAAVEVVGIEFGFSQLEDMGVVYAYEAARWFAGAGDGLIKNDQDEWYRVDEIGAFDPLR